MFHKIYLETGWKLKNDVICVSCILVYCTGRPLYSWCQILQMFSHAFHFSMRQPKISDESVYSSELKYSHLNKEPRSGIGATYEGTAHYVKYSPTVWPFLTVFWHVTLWMEQEISIMELSPAFFTFTIPKQFHKLGLADMS